MRYLGLLGVIALVFASGQPGHAQSNFSANLSAYAQPQTLVTLPGGRKLNLVCQGPQDGGTPTVVLTAGTGGWSATWNAVQPLVARTTRVCAWDRPGFGFSDASTLTQSAANLVEDLAAALKAANIPAPYVLVAHSAGSFETLLFADGHRREIAGMVLVDPSLPDMVQRVGAISPPAAAFFRTDLSGRAAALHRCAANPAQPAPADAGICFLLPDYARPLTETLASREHEPARLQTRASLYEQFETSVRLLANPARNYGNMPLAILTSENTPVAALPAEPPARAALQALWNSGHDEMAGLSRRGSNRVVPGTSHLIHLEQPQAVAGAIARMVEQARER
jgi:pimeloyl-ACP methyl ester carboxylesterase